jgi:hypothetical protein
MEYRGKYEVFDAGTIRTYPVAGRPNRVKLADLMEPAAAMAGQYALPAETRKALEATVAAVVEHHRAGLPVVFFTGAHLVKNGLSPLLIDLVRRGIFRLVATNAAGAIHDFELALIGETSETVPNALPKGEFGMAYEFCYLNEALRLGEDMKLGFGEALGRMMCDGEFREQVLGTVRRNGSPEGFAHPGKSLLATAYGLNVPVTIHAGIGTDVIDQHPNFDGASKGGTSGRDFLIFTRVIRDFVNGGMFVNMACAVTAPEVLLKAVSMAASAGYRPKRITTADFDIRGFDATAMTDEHAAGYYQRDQKSIVTRVPEAFDGKGYYVQGNQNVTFPAFYQSLVRALS